MTVSYRTRCFLKRLAIWLAVLAVVAVIALICWLLWLNRYVLYTRDRGAVLDFSVSSQELTGQRAEPSVIENPVSIYYNEGANTVHIEKDLTQMIGYYVTGKDLETDLQGVYDKIKTLSPDVPVMLDMKSIYGNFFYSSAVSENRNGDLDIAAMDAMLREINSKYYTIARVPALRDRLYGLEHVNDGLPVAAGYLWMDDYGCYWLNPASDGTVSYLVAIANELKNLGFDEVVFTDYYFPSASSIVFNGDKTQALSKAAQTVVNTCASDSFTVSFTMENTFTPPIGRSRIYLENAAAANASMLADSFGFEDPAAQVVFLTDVHDTRFDEYSVLRPIADAE